MMRMGTTIPSAALVAGVLALSGAQGAMADNARHVIAKVEAHARLRDAEMEGHTPKVASTEDDRVCVITRWGGECSAPGDPEPLAAVSRPWYDHVWWLHHRQAARANEGYRHCISKTGDCGEHQRERITPLHKQT
jgi:hypothetical protein